MSAVASTRSQPSQVLRCEQCGDQFELSTRNLQRYRSQGREPRCMLCRRPRLPLSDSEREKFSGWWRERFSLEELVELANAIWQTRCGCGRRLGACRKLDLRCSLIRLSTSNFLTPGRSHGSVLLSERFELGFGKLLEIEQAVVRSTRC